jgi:predicted nucleotidyltransferase
MERAALIGKLAASLERRPEVLEAYLFGSCARGEARPHSDVDVAVFLDLEQTPDSPFGPDAEIATDLMQILATDEVDVVLLNQADPVLYHEVLRDGLRLFSRDLGKTTVREGRALSRYCDYVPQLQKINAIRAARFRRGDFGR